MKKFNDGRYAVEIDCGDNRLFTIVDTKENLFETANDLLKMKIEFEKTRYNLSPEIITLMQNSCEEELLKLSRSEFEFMPPDLKYSYLS